MKVRLTPQVKLRADVFGGLCYVPQRDDFFAANKEVFAFVQGLGREWKDVVKSEIEAVTAIARLGICETKAPYVKSASYSGPSFLGEFIELPTVSQPLVVNCFCTAHCPLACIYCHADDLMKKFRAIETEIDLDNVAATANMVPAMVAVITGGDPLTRPDRAKRLIERLAGDKALVLDTSGVGDIDLLVPTLKLHEVHVRVSIDSISAQNQKLRPASREYGFGRNASQTGAAHTIQRCLEEKIPLSVQTVVSSMNENLDEWRDLRDWLINQGVRNWILHVVVKGGSARRMEEAASRQKRPRSILPSPGVYKELWRLVDETQRDRLPIDIRCTDTDTTPNSVLLVGSKGDLYTEGYAHNGKVALYEVGNARPDLIQALWPHLDRFGHARRYLNWNPWFFNGRSLETICYHVPVPKRSKKIDDNNPVETEAKYKVRNLPALEKRLIAHGYAATGNATWQRDEYFDTPDKLTSRLDYVVRLRSENGSVAVALKGPRSWSGQEYSRIELEIPGGPEAEVRTALQKGGFDISWYFEKKRKTYRHPRGGLVVAIDEIPQLGFFVEIEGRLEAVRSMETTLKESLGEQESKNYAELFRAYKISKGARAEDVKGASFDSK